MFESSRFVATER